MPVLFVKIVLFAIDILLKWSYKVFYVTVTILYIFENGKVYMNTSNAL